MWDNFKSIFEDRDLFTAMILAVVALVSFGLGRWSVSPQQDVYREEYAEAAAQDVVPARVDADTYIASSGGTKYHLPWCAGALQIKEENKIIFESKEAAEAAGYTPAANCKGI